MKKFFAILVIVVFFVNGSSCFAESLLSKFDKNLKGTWVSYKYNNYSKPDVAEFTFSGNNKVAITVETHPGFKKPLVKDTLVKDMYLFEEGNGDIWLVLGNPVASGYISAKIAMSEDGNFLYVIDSISLNDLCDIHKRKDLDDIYRKKGFHGIYKKVAK